MTDVEYLRQLLLSNSHEGSFELTSHEVSGFYFDTRPLLLDSHVCRMISGLFFSRIPSDVNVVAGTGLSGGLITSAILQFSLKPMKGLIIRGTRRRHGLQKIVEGDALVSNCNVVFVDDLISTGSTFRRVQSALYSQRGCRVVHAIFLIDRRIKPVDLEIPITCFFKADSAGELLKIG